MILHLIRSLADHLKRFLFGLIDLAIRSRIVDFPPPEGPTIATEVYALIVKLNHQAKRLIIVE